MYVQATNTDYKVVIRLPSIEYSIPAKNFTFIKTLTQAELCEFMEAKFFDWHLMSIDTLLRQPSFQELTVLVDRAGMSPLPFKEIKEKIASKR